MCFGIDLQALFSKSDRTMAAQPVTPRRINLQRIPAFTNNDSLRNPDYLPKSRFDLFCGAAVTATIDNEFPSSDTQEKRTLIEYARQNRRIFLTLASTFLVQKIGLLRDAQIEDSHLPVRMEIDSRTGGGQIFSLNDHVDLPLNGFVERDDASPDANNWNLAQLRSFVGDQWQFCAVAFQQSRFRYEGIPEKCPLPFIQISEGAAGGAFGKVFRVGLRGEHLTFEPGDAEFLYLRQVRKFKLRKAYPQYQC